MREQMREGRRPRGRRILLLTGIVVPMACALLAAAGLSACTVQAPDPPDFGVRMGGGEVVVADPMCPSESLAGALVSVSSDGGGRGDGFETLWSVSGPVSAEARSGVFHIRSARSFRAEEMALVGRLPDSFFVETRLVVDGRTEEGDDGAIDLEARAAQLAAGEYVTWEGKVLTRDQINAQRKCGPSGGSG